MKPPPTPEAGNRSSERSPDRSCDHSYDQRRLVAALAVVLSRRCTACRHLSRRTSRTCCSPARTPTRSRSRSTWASSTSRRSPCASATARRSCGSIAGSPRSSTSTSLRSPAPRPPGRRRRRARARVRGGDARLPAGRALASHCSSAARWRREHVDALAGEVADFPRPRRVAPQRRRRSARPSGFSPTRCENFEEIRPLADDRAPPPCSPRCATGRGASTRALLALRAPAPRRRLRARVPRRPAPRQHRAARRRGHGLRLHRVQRRAALDRRDERGRVRRDGPRRPRPRGPRAAASSTATSRPPATTTGLAVLRFYLVYRALVRAKVACLRAVQLADAADAQAALSRVPRLRRAGAHASRSRGRAGPDRHARPLRARARRRSRRPCSSDRRVAHPHRRRAQAPARPCGRRRAADRRSTPGLRPTATRRTYARLAQAAKAVLDAGYACDRRRARSWSARSASGFRAPRGGAARALRDRRLRGAGGGRCARASRSARRAATDASEADLAVLERQLARREPLAADERALAMRTSTPAIRRRAGEAVAARRARAASTRHPDAMTPLRRLQRRCGRPVRVAAVAPRRARRRAARHRRQARHRAARARAARSRRPVTVLDVSLDVNRAALRALLERGAAVDYFDHHQRRDPVAPAA